LPTGWELIGRLAVVIGLAGVLGICGRLGVAWLRRRRPPHS